MVARVEKEGGGGGVHDHLVGGAAGTGAAAAIARRRGAAGAGASASGEGPGLAHPGRSLRSVLSLPAMASLLMAWRGRPAAGGGSRAVTFWALIRRFCFKYHGIPDDLRCGTRASMPPLPHRKFLGSINQVGADGPTDRVVVCLGVCGCRCVCRARAWDLIGEALGVNYDERFFRLLCNGAWVEECYREQVRRECPLYAVKKMTEAGTSEQLGRS